MRADGEFSREASLTFDSTFVPVADAPHTNYRRLTSVDAGSVHFGGSGTIRDPELISFAAGEVNTIGFVERHVQRWLKGHIVPWRDENVSLNPEYMSIAFADVLRLKQYADRHVVRRIPIAKLESKDAQFRSMRSDEFAAGQTDLLKDSACHRACNNDENRSNNYQRVFPSGFFLAIPVLFALGWGISAILLRIL